MKKVNLLQIILALSSIIEPIVEQIKKGKEGKTTIPPKENRTPEYLEDGSSDRWWYNDVD